MLKVLFVCVHNSARSQMAETFLNDLGKGKFFAESAGIEKGMLNPYAVQAMADIGYDISNNSVDSVFDFFIEERRYDLVIKVCDESAGQRCPVFPSTSLTLIWSFPDPAELKGSNEEIMAEVCSIRDAIRTRIEEMIRVINV